MRTAENRLLEKLAPFAAFAIPACAAVLTASPEPYWLDSPEFTAAAQTLGIPHPPGHPLYVILTKPFTLLPFGSIALRVSIAAAVFGSLASLVLYHLLHLILAVTIPSARSWWRQLLALSGSVTASLSPGWWFQSVRAEVYSLQILLVLIALSALVTAALADEKQRFHLLCLSALTAGLSMTNHHYITAVALPAAIPLIVAQARHEGGTKTLWMTARLVAIGCHGLLPYLFLPLRSIKANAVSLGGVHSITDFLWVVSAQVYQKSMGRTLPGNLASRSLDAVFTLMGDLHPVIVVAGIVGFYLLISWRATRMVGLVVTLLTLITVLLRSVMGFDPFNPDFHGYMLPAIAGLVIGFTTVCSIAVDVLARSFRRGYLFGSLLVCTLVAVPLIRGRASFPQSDLSDFKATRLYLDLATGRATPGTLVLTTYYKSFFVVWSAQYIDGSRPDITVVNPMFLSYPGYLRSTLAKHPDLKPLAREMVVEGRLTETAIAQLTWSRPVLIEPDPLLEDGVSKFMLPNGPFYRASSEPQSRRDIQAASADHFARWRAFYDQLGPAWSEHETWRILSWSHFQDAVFMARRGATSEALRAIEMSRALGSKSPEIEALFEALQDTEGKKIDVAPFLPATMKASTPNF
jgi:hypothetical protein